jgi:transcriptional regulator with XRE-family HTH domain
MPSFAVRLKELRAKSGVQQKEIAALLSVQPRTVRFYESGEHEPNIESIKKLAEFFLVSTDYLLGHSDDPQRR